MQFNDLYNPTLQNISIYISTYTGVYRYIVGKNIYESKKKHKYICVACTDDALSYSGAAD